jgi:hypothetical protein
MPKRATRTQSLSNGFKYDVTATGLGWGSSGYPLQQASNTLGMHQCEVALTWKVTCSQVSLDMVDAHC